MVLQTRMNGDRILRFS